MEIISQIILWLAGLPTPITVLIIILVTMIMFLWKFDSIKKLFVEKIKNKKRRSCGDCILILFSKNEQYHTEKDEIKNSILDNQMTFASHKVDSLFLDLVRTYSKDLIEFRKKNDNIIDYDRENKEYIIYKETLMNALDLCKKELRRSFKENGFHSKSSVEFNEYVRKQIETLLSIARTYMTEKYPNNNMIVPLEYRFEKMDLNRVSGDIMEVYLNAKQIRTDTENQIESLKMKLKEDINKFIENK